MTMADTNRAMPARVDTLGPGDNRSAPLNIVIGLEGLNLGGCPINALDLGRSLRARGHRVSVFAIEEDIRVSLLPYAKRCGFQVTVLPKEAGTLRRAWQIRSFARRRSADVVHVFAPWLGPAATIATSATTGAATVVTNWMMENVDYTPQRTPLILGTTMLQEEAQRSHRSPVWLVEPPVDVDADSPDAEQARRFRGEYEITDDEIAVVVVSRLDVDLKAEGIEYAIEAVARLDLPQLRLVVVGDGNAFVHIAEQAERVNRELGRPAIILTGALHDPRPAYAAADISLGMGGSALRALAHGNPLIVLGVHGFARVFEPATADYFYRAGFFGDGVTNDPVGHIAEQVNALMDKARRTSLGSFGLGEVRARFSLDSSAEKLETIYRTTLETAPSLAARVFDLAHLTTRALVHDFRKMITSMPARR